MINEFHFSAAVVPPPPLAPLPPEAVVILFVLVLYVCVCDEAGRKGISLTDTGWAGGRLCMRACPRRCLGDPVAPGDNKEDTWGEGLLVVACELPTHGTASFPISVIPIEVLHLCF